MFSKKIMKKIIFSFSVIAVCTLLLNSKAYATDLDLMMQTMTPEQLAQEQARIEEQYRLEQQAREQAASDAAYLAAQAKAQQQEAADAYLKWGDTALPYNYTPEVTNYLAGNQYNAAVDASKVSPQSLGVKTVDLIIFCGQSNMSGAGGRAVNAPKVSPKAGLEFRAASDPTALYPITEPFGVREGGYMGESPIVKQGSLVSSFINTYYSRCGTPVVAVSASRGGTDSAYWAGSGARNDLLSRFTKAMTYLSSNGIKVRHKYLVFLQGESDSNGKVTPAQYTANINAAFAALFNAGLEQVFIITPGYAQGGFINYDQIVATQENMCATSNRYTLASEKLRTLPATSAYMSDEVHYNQKALNLVGADAAARVVLGY